MQAKNCKELETQEHPRDCCCVDCITSVPEKEHKPSGDRKVKTKLANVKWKNLDHFVPTTSFPAKKQHQFSGDCKRRCKRVIFENSSKAYCNKILSELVDKISRIIVKCDDAVADSSSLVRDVLKVEEEDDLTKRTSTSNFGLSLGDSESEGSRKSHPPDCCCIDCITK